MKPINLLTLYHQQQAKQRHQFYLYTVASLIIVSAFIILLHLHILTKLNQLHLRQHRLLNTIKPSHQSKLKTAADLPLNYIKTLGKLSKLFDAHVWLTKLTLTDKIINLYGNIRQPDDALNLKQKIKKSFTHFTLCKLNINRHHFTLMLNITPVCGNNKNV